MVTVWAKVRTSGGFKIISGDRHSNNSMHGMPPFFISSQGFSKYHGSLKRALWPDLLHCSISMRNRGLCTRRDLWI